METTQHNASPKWDRAKWVLLAVWVVFSAAQYAAADFSITIEDPTDANSLTPLGSLNDPALTVPDDPLAEFTIDDEQSSSRSDNPFNLSARPVEVDSDKKDPGEEVWDEVYASIVKTNTIGAAAINGTTAANHFRTQNLIADMEDVDETQSSLIMSKPVIMGIIIGVGLALLGLRRVLRI
ncbi:MAG: hypothetical protein JXR23_06000 [Pontiellaceae bacterium]|nr:hypothetical protein [Pontiellaceae bacterium]